MAQNNDYVEENTGVLLFQLPPDHQPSGRLPPYTRITDPVCRSIIRNCLGKSDVMEPCDCHRRDFDRVSHEKFDSL